MKDSDSAQIAQRIKTLDQQVIHSRIERNELNKEARKLAETRDEFNEKFKKLRDEIQLFKSKRDDLNTQVRALKTKRDQARETVSKNRAQIKSLTEKLNTLDSLVPGSYESTRKDIEKLEWRIQTTPFSQREENKLIAQIKELESQLNTLKKKKEMEKKIGQIHDESKSIELQANIIHKRLTELAMDSEVYHKKMMEVVSSATGLKRKADEAHQAYITSRTKGDNAHIEYLSRIAMIKELENQIRNYYESEQTQKEDEVQKKIEDLSTNKLKKGKKLTFEEFKFLVDRGAI